MTAISRFPVPELNNIADDLRTRMLEVQQRRASFQTSFSLWHTARTSAAFLRITTHSC